jgi:hypothetical protein
MVYGMHIDSSAYRTALIITMLLLVCGCAHYGRLKIHKQAESGALLRELSADAQHYTVHYHGGSEKIVSGILFDPKNDAKTIHAAGPLWQPLLPTQNVADIIDNIAMGDFPGYLPNLYEILGPEGDFYGYLYTGWFHLVIKPVDPQTVKVYGLRGPPQYENETPGKR